MRSDSLVTVYCGARFSLDSSLALLTGFLNRHTAMENRTRHRIALVALAVVLAPALIAGQTLGKLDPTFGTGGRLITNFGGYGETARGLAVQPDGKIVAAGWTISNAGTDFALAR